MDFHELFGHLATYTDTLARCHYDCYIIAHFVFRI